MQDILTVLFSSKSHGLQPTSLTLFSTIQFQFTTITSRSTSYFLFSFWIFFFFFGEQLFLILFNYSTLVDSIISSSFFTIKQHVTFLLITSPVKLVTHINFYIIFLTTCAFLFLFNFNYSTQYLYFRRYSIILGIILFIFLYFIC